jgi:hypothetical protein
MLALGHSLHVARFSPRCARRLLLALPVVALGCGGTLAAGSGGDAAAGSGGDAAAGSGGDAAADSGRDAVPPSSDASCGFDLLGEDVAAHVTGKSAVAYPAGTEIPFAFFQCVGEAGGANYTLSGQYMPDASSIQIWVGIDVDAADVPQLTNFCPVHGSLGPAPDAGDRIYAIGAPLSLRFTCDFSNAPPGFGQGGPVKLTDGHFNARLTRN